MGTTTLDKTETSQPVLTQIVLRLEPVVTLTDDQLYDFALLNRELRVERNVHGELIIMPPCGGQTSERNSELTMQLRQWSKRSNEGVTFDSSGGFRLPNGSVRSPDAAWVGMSRLEQLTPDERQRFVPLCPEFLVELRSPSDSLSALKDKMLEYLENGTQLGWLIDADNRQVYVYRQGSEMQLLSGIEKISAAPVLDGFELDLREIW